MRWYITFKIQIMNLKGSCHEKNRSLSMYFIYSIIRCSKVRIGIRISLWVCMHCSWKMICRSILKMISILMDRIMLHPMRGKQLASFLKEVFYDHPMKRDKARWRRDLWGCEKKKKWCIEGTAVTHQEVVRTDAEKKTEY